METPKEQIPLITTESYHDYVNTNVNKYVGYLGLMCAATLVVSFISKFAFSYLGENVTLRIRFDLYKSILRKNIGWFDEIDHSPSILTSAMA